MSPAPQPPLRLHGPRAGLIRLLVLPPAAMATFSPPFELALRRTIAPESLAFSAMMLLIAGLGLAHALTRATLIADEGGIRWSRGLERRHLRWTEIEEIGAAGKIAPLSRESFERDASGLGFKLSATNPAVARAARRETPRGYDVVLANEFEAPTQLIVEELRSRWRAHRSAGLGRRPTRSQTGAPVRRRLEPETFPEGHDFRAGGRLEG